MEEFLSKGQKQWLPMKVKPFTMKNDVLYKMGQDNILKRCLSTIEAHKVMKELHEGTLRGHFLQTRQMEQFLSIGQKQQLTRKVKPFIMKNDVLYKMGQDNRFR